MEACRALVKRKFTGLITDTFSVMANGRCNTLSNTSTIIRPLSTAVATITLFISAIIYPVAMTGNGQQVQVRPMRSSPATSSASSSSARMVLAMLLLLPLAVWSFPPPLRSTTTGTTTATHLFAKAKKPRMIVFDLDGCLWKPELYHLTKRGLDQSPFVVLPGGTRCRSQLGSVVALFPDVAEILDHLVLEERDTIQLAISSRTDQPEWATELLEKMILPRSGLTVAQAIAGPWEMASQDRKVLHFERLSLTTGIPLEECMFFDDVTGNCKAVSRMGVTTGFTPKGLTRAIFDTTMAKFPTTWGVVGLEI